VQLPKAVADRVDQEPADPVHPDHAARRVDQRRTGEGTSGQSQPRRSGLDHLVGRAGRGHRVRPALDPGATDHGADLVDQCDAGPLAPIGEQRPGPIGERHHIGVGMRQPEDPGVPGRPLAHRLAGLVTPDVDASPEQRDGRRQADDPATDHRHPHSGDAISGTSVRCQSG
jgi:hypothetical protein